MPHSDSALFDHVMEALDAFQIEIPSWGFANTGTRFGKFVQAAAASTLEEKFADAAEVNRLTGVTPTIALHVLWDLPNGIDDIPELKRLEQRYGVKAGSINPNLFQDQEYKFGSLCNPDRHPPAGPGARAQFDRNRQRNRLPRYLALASGRLQLPRLTEHTPADRLAGRGPARSRTTLSLPTSAC